MFENEKDLHGNAAVADLSREQLIERLEGAALVVQSLETRHRLATVIIESYKQTVADRDAVIMNIEGFMQRTARKLAGSADGSHAHKNYVLLSVISDLLVMCERRYPQHEPDEVPF